MSGESPGYIAALDVGTTTLRCQIFDRFAKCRGSNFGKVKLHYPEPNTAEINPDELWLDIIDVIRNAIKDAKISDEDVKSMGVSTQRATFLTWRKDNGKPLHNFITWKDLRAAELIDQINKSWKMLALRTGSSFMHMVSRQIKFGTVGNLRFTSSQVSEEVTIRLLWLLQNDKEVQSALTENNLMFGTMDTWLIYKLTGGRTYVSDISNASATGLYDPFSLCWSFIPKYLHIPESILPPVVPNAAYDFGKTSPDLFGVPIKIGAVMADQSASMFGSCSFDLDSVKLTLGTGAFFNVNTGPTIRATSKGMYPLVGWKYEEELVYFVEVACSDAGSLIQWMLAIGLISTLEDLNEVSNDTKDNGGVYFVCAFSGLGPPINNESAGSGFIGIKPQTTKNHLIRAVLESIVYRTTLAFNLLSLNQPQCIKVDGGVARNNFICQSLADLTGLKIIRANSEMSTLGVAYLAGISCGFWKSTHDLSVLNRDEDIFKPTDNASDIESLKLNLQNWKKAAERFKSWHE